MRLSLSLAVLAIGLALAPSAIAADGQSVYRKDCAYCHGEDREGGQGPSLLPENLGRLRPDQASKVIGGGRAATQMPAFGDVLKPDEIAAVTEFIYRAPERTPKWDAADIAASREITAARLSDTPTFAADPQNLFVVVESGDHHVSILDGDRFEVLSRFKSRYALHGGPKFSADGRYVFFGSRDGWVTKYDLYNLQVVAEVRAGLNSRNIALSSDGRFVAVANYLPHSLVLLDAADLSLRKLIAVDDARHTRTSRVSAVYDARPRQSFILALKDVAELWEVSYDENHPPVYPGMVHSYEKGMVEALGAGEGLFSVRRIPIEEPLDDFMFDPDYRNVLGAMREGKPTAVINLNVGRPVASVPLEGLPHLASGITWTVGDRPVMATPHLNRALLSFIDMRDWSIVRTIKTAGPGFFLRSHENTPYAWLDAMMGKDRDVIQIIDKRSLEIVRTIVPEPGKTAAHVEFTRDGSYALVSLWEDDGAIVVIDTTTFAEVKRLPMAKPSGKYNVYNKTHLSEGTSH